MSCTFRAALVLMVVLALIGCSDDTPSGGDASATDARLDRPVVDADLDSRADDAASPRLDGSDGGDGGADAGDPCAPLSPTPTRARFAALQAGVAAASDAAARQARVDAFLAALGDDYPLRDVKGVVLLSDKPSSVAGSFNGWTPAAMKRLSDTTLHYAELDIGSGEARYKLVDGSQWRRDPLNHHVTWDGIPRQGLGLFNSVVPAYGATKSATAGRLEVLRVKSPQLSNTRDVFVYLPPGYDAERCDERPLLLVNDGNESLTRAHFDAVADATLGAKRSRSLLIAFVALAEQGQRNDEYGSTTGSRGDEYADFLCDTLIPALEARYRLQRDRRARGVIGASLGGLSAFATLLWRNDCFTRAGAQSGSFWYENEALIQRAQSGPAAVIDAAYLDNGSDNRDSTLKMRDVLLGRGYPVVHGENLSQGHTWDAWADRFDEALAAMFAPSGKP